MRFVGEIRGLYNFLVDFTKNKTRTRWVLFSELTEEDRKRGIDNLPPEDSLLSDTQIISKIKGTKPYVISAMTVNRVNSPIDFYGQESVMSRVLKIYKDVLSEPIKYNADIREDSNGNECLVGFTHPDLQLIPQYVSESHSSIKKIDGLEMTPYLNLNSSASRALSETVRSMGHKSLQRLKEEKDFSWCMDEFGNIFKEYEVVHTMQRLQELMEEMEQPQYEYVAVDSETTGLRFNALPAGHEGKDVIVGMSLTWKMNQGIYIPFEHTKFQNVPKKEALALIFSVLEKKKNIAHNGMFDIRVFADEGFRLHLTEDTQILAFHLNPTVSKGNTALKKLTHTRYGHETLELDDIFPSKNDAGLFKHLPLDLTKIYACADTDYTYRLFFDMLEGTRTEDDGSVDKYYIEEREDGKKYKMLYPRLSTNGKLLYAMDIKVVNHLSIDERYGNRVDMDLLETLNNANNEDLTILEELIYSYVGQLRMLINAKEMLESEGMPEEEINKYLEELKKDERFKKARYTFKISSGTDLGKVMYDELKYPIYYLTKSGTPATDKFALKELLREESEEPARWLIEDVQSTLAKQGVTGLDSDDEILIPASKFSSLKYPLALLVQKWKDLEKLRTSFFANLLEGNTDGWYFSGYRFTSAETARIINPIQTLKGALKKLIIPYSKDYYMFVFDYAAIEYRTMAYESKNEELIKKLNDPETDYHREVGAGMMGTTPEDMTKAQRSDIKAVNFAVPYGMGAASLGANLARQRGEAYTPQHKLEAEILLEKWKGSNHKLYSALTAYRKMAVEKGVVIHAWGRMKTFDISPESMKDNKHVASIERQAGNYPIQALARDIFAMGYLKLKNRLQREGLLEVRPDTGSPSVTTPNLVHDEMVSIVHKSIHPYQMYQYILEECMLEFEGHPTYFAGINVVNNWYEGKADKYEAPIRFVWEKVKDFKSNPDKYKKEVDNALLGITNYTELVLEDISTYMFKRYQLELFKLDQSWTTPSEDGKHRFDLTTFMTNYKDYFLKPKMRDFIKSKREFNKKNDEDSIYALTESLVLDYLNPTQVIFIANGEEVPATNIYGEEPTAIYAMPTREEIELSAEAYIKQIAEGETNIQDINVQQPLGTTVVNQLPSLGELPMEPLTQLEELPSLEGNQLPLTTLAPLEELQPLQALEELQPLQALPELDGLEPLSTGIKFIPLKQLGDTAEDDIEFDSESSMREEEFSNEASLIYELEDSTEMIIPIHSFKAKNPMGFTIKDVDPRNVKSLADAIDFGIEKVVVKESMGVMIEDPLGNLVLNVKGANPNMFKALHQYFKSVHNEDGQPLVYVNGNSRVASKLKIKTYDKQRLADILGIDVVAMF